jgi:SAM domain (Sterile alpha motif)
MRRPRRGAASSCFGTRMDDLHQWLEGIGLGYYTDRLIANDIDRETLLLLGDEDFDRLGISLGHRKVLINAASEFRPTGQRGRR